MGDIELGGQDIGHGPGASQWEKYSSESIMKALESRRQGKKLVSWRNGPRLGSCMEFDI